MRSALTPLILGVAEAEERAMDEVELRRQLERAHADCFGWAMACCGRDRDDAEEVLQTVYLTVLDGRARYDGRSTFRTWLFGVIRRTATSERRKTWLRGLLLMREAGSLKPEAPAPPDAEVECDSRHHRLHHALARLAARQREVLQLVFYHEMNGRRSRHCDGHLHWLSENPLCTWQGATRRAARQREGAVTMMDESELRRRFAELREADRERAPSFAQTYGRAPTDVFLRTPGSELLAAMPALGASVLDTMIPIPSNRGT